MILHNPKGIFYIRNFEQFVEMCDISSNGILPTAAELREYSGVTLIQDEGVVEIAADCESFGKVGEELYPRQDAKAAFFAYFPQFKCLNLIIGGSNDHADRSDSFTKGVHGFVSATGTCLTSDPNYARRLDEYRHGGRVAEILREELWDNYFYRKAVESGTRKKLEIKLVRWKI